MRRPLVLLLAILVLVGTASAQTGSKTPVVAAQWLAAWNSHEVEEVIPLLTPDVMYEDVTFSVVNHGSADLRKFASFFFDAVPDMKFELVNCSIRGRHGTIEWTFSGTDKGVYKTGKKFTVRGVSVITLDDRGKISRNLDYYDAATIMRQVGLLPAATK